jgi:hypothetical protein
MAPFLCGRYSIQPDKFGAISSAYLYGRKRLGAYLRGTHPVAQAKEWAYCAASRLLIASLAILSMLRAAEVDTEGYDGWVCAHRESTVADRHSVVGNRKVSTLEDMLKTRSCFAKRV